MYIYVHVSVSYRTFFSAEKADELLGSALVEILLEVSTRMGIFSVVSLDNDAEENTEQEGHCGTSKENGETPSEARSAKRQKLDEELFHTRVRLV